MLWYVLNFCWRKHDTKGLKKGLEKNGMKEVSLEGFSSCLAAALGYVLCSSPTKSSFRTFVCCVLQRLPKRMKWVLSFQCSERRKNDHTMLFQRITADSDSSEARDWMRCVTRSNHRYLLSMVVCEWLAIKLFSSLHLPLQQIFQALKSTASHHSYLIIYLLGPLVPTLTHLPDPLQLRSSPQVERSFALIDQLNEPLDEALCSQAVEAALRTQRPQMAGRFMETSLGKMGRRKDDEF